MRRHSFLVTFAIAFIFLLDTAIAQQVDPRETQPSITVHPTVIRTGTFLGITPKLRDIKPTKKTGGIIGKNQVSAERNEKPEFNSELSVRNYPYFTPTGPDPVWQRNMGMKRANRAPILNFAGQASPYMPSDCNGSVGANYFMQGVNSSYAIYDKNTGTQVVSSTAFNTLFNGVTGANYNDGDIIVLYDDNAGRWFASEFSISGSNDYQMIAVSVTGDPTGSWYKWSFDVDDLPDYGKFGIWEDGYYMADNNTSGNDIYVFDRATMLAGGASPTMIAFNNPNRPNSGFHCIEPLDCDGSWAPAGTPGQFITINDDAWGGSDQLWIYECSADWVTPSNSTFARTQTIGVSAFDSNFGTGWDNITQPNTQKLDAIPQILMYRAQYRNLGTTQTIVCAHTVDVDNTDHAGIRWYELQNSGATWTVRQSGTYAPDGDSRWLPSIAMDGQRNISVAYNVSSSSTYPSIRYAAQSAAENALASGTLDIAEESIQVGTQAQTTYNRWGDYAEMSIDPVDDVTFWFTTEYYNSGKKTKIANWRFGVAPLPPNTNFVINTPNTLLRPVPILQGNSATFTNLTTGQVDNWLWTFQNGTPGTSTAQDPGSITYNTVGLWDVSLYADNAYGDSTLTRTDYIKVIDPTVVTCDTLVQFYGTPTIYTSSGGGYVGGTNEYGCSAIAEKFDNFSPYNKITGGRFYWAQATNGTSPNVTFVLWGDDGSGAPGTQLATKVVPLSTIVTDMATLGYTDIAFPADVPLPSTGAFFLGFEMPGDAASGDTLAIVTNNDSDGPDDTGYSLYSGWESYSAWSMSLMNAIFAYGCYDPFMPPVADFEGVPTTVNAGSTVSFTDLSYGGTPTSWSWSFSGGTPNTSTAQNPTITYNTPGYYDVSLTVTNAYGNDTETKTNYIHVVDPNSCSCGELGNVVGSQVLYTTGNGYVSGNNQYDDEAKAEYFDSYAPYTEINGAYLYFGYAYVANSSTNITINIWDNTGTGGAPGTVVGTTTVPITTIANDVTNGDSTYVTFPAVTIPGPFYIGFIIPNPSGAGDTVALMSGQMNSSTPNTAWERWSGGTWYAYSDGSSWGGDWNLSVFPVVCSTGAPLVDFTVNNTLVAAGNTLDFTDLSTCGPTSWSWNFGGGGTPNTSTAQNPSITFNTPGIYDVTLTATNGSGSNSEMKTSYITVLEPIVWWDFPNNPDDNTADGGIAANLTKTIDVFGGATLQGFASGGASTNSAQARNFSSGLDSKGWVVDFTTSGYGSLLLYSKQNGDNRSPLDWKVQYSTDGSTWIDVAGATITCANDWTTGVLNAISLPTACENQPTVYLRWIMTSNNGIGGSIFNTRDNLIDDIMVAGVAIGAPPVADFSADVTALCEGGTVTFTDLSTNSPTSWDWDFGDGTPHATQQNPSHVYATAGTYTVVLIATNSAGSDTETKTNYITVNPNPTVTTSVTDVSCNSGSDGSATATPAGGTAPYGFAWNTGGSAATISSLTVGTYTVTVTDANTCTGTGSATVSQPATALSANITASSNVNCFGDSDGSATVTASGGTSPYSYSWPSGGTNVTETGLAAGSYIVTVTDANSCTATATANISEPATALSTTISGTDVSCNGGSDGTATVTAGGGTSPYSYLWNTTATTASISGLIAGTYSCTITDANGCTSNESITLTEPATVLTTSISGTNISCNGGSDGDATVTAGGGTSPYTYLWTGGQTTASISGLIAGTYSCTITDANGCTSNESITLTEPATALSTTISSTNVSCNGGSDGDATVTASGGTSPYTYLWTGGQTTVSISGLIAGSYSVTVTDANGCTSVSSTNITEPTVLTTSISGTNISCNGGSDGDATVTVGGGTSPYSYLWNTTATTASISGLIAGTYSCTITDANGCTSNESITLTEPATALNTSISGTNISCNGGSDGTATVTAGGGTSPYFYLWNTTATTASISGLIAGTYSCTITDANGCISNESITLTEPATALSTTISSTNVSCNGGSDGDATVTASDGTSPYTYLWTGGQTTVSISGLIAGSYSVTVTDANGCTSVSSTNITEPTVLTTSISGTNISCNGSNDGTASVTSSGGTSPYTYLWTGGQTTVSITGLSAGTYNCTITDANGCTSIESYIVTEPIVLSTSVSVSDASCNGTSDGSATVTPAGGTTPYTFVWSSGGTNATETGLLAGNYTVTVTDANGCIATDNAIIGEPTAIVITETHNDATCGSSNGDATVTVSGGTSPYTYLWTGGQTTASISGLSAGSYTVTVTDANTCSNTLTVSISNIGGPTLTISSTDVSCNGGNDGTASVVVTGGTPGYTYLWSSGGITANETGLTAGNYTVTVTDASSCAASTSITVNEPSVISAINTIVDVSCNGGNDGSISLAVSGGTSPYTFIWSSGGTTNTETSLIAGTYDVTIADANSCTFTNSYTVNEPTALAVTSSTVDVVCNGGTSGSATVSVSGGTSPYTYAWSSGGNGATESGLNAGNYSCTITDANSCTITESVTINEPLAMVLTMNSTDATCGSSNGTADVSVSGGTSPYTYLWSTGGTTSSISSLGAGTYIVTVTDASSCQENNSVSIIQTPAVTASAIISDVSCNGGNDGSISLTVTSGTSPYTFIWSSGGTTNTETSLIAGTYDVTITDANSCTFTNSYTVNEPTALAVTSSTVDVVCNGGTSGSATVSVSGGTSPYTYAWSSGGNGATESGLNAGNYSCTITDANSCTITESVTINEPLAMVLTMNSTDATCGSLNGTADVSVSGGTSPYTYLWSTGGTGISISSLAAGSYAITVTDANSCQEISSVIVNNIGGPTLTVTTTDVLCYGGTDGSATVSATGGTLPYTYLWSSGGTGITETGLSAGNYTVTVTDASTCSTTANAIVNEPTAISVTAIITDATCGGCTDGSIDLTVTGGTSPYTYAWSSGGTGATETGLGAGTYTVTITDSNGCADIESYIVNEPSSLTITIVSTIDVTCNGGSDGAATISVTGGVSPYTYAWSSGGVGTTETGLSAGTYTVTVTDANLASGTQTIIINEPSAISMTFTTTDANCGSSDGSADVTVVGGTSPYTYLWSDGSTTTSVTALAAGTYYLTVTDSVACQMVDSIVIGNIGGPTLTITGTDVTCYGASDGMVTVVATGGSTPYTYVWSSGGTTDTDTGLIAGTYSVTVTDAGGCQSIESITINEPTQIVVTDSIVDVSCSGNSDGAIYLTVAGGNTPYSFAWSSGGTSVSETGLIGGTYSVTITDNNGCSDIESYTVNESAGLTLSLVSSSDITCNGSNNGSATVSVTGGTSPFTYLWTNGSITATAFNLSAGTYTVTATDANNCTATLDVTINEPAAMTVNVISNNAHCGNSDGSIIVAVSGGTSPYIYLWSNGATTDSLSGLAMGIYIVTITDANGCEQVSTNIINNLDAPTVMATGTDVSCFGGNDGTATAIVTGGTTPYSFLWNSGGTASIENGLIAGNYIVTVTDANNCSAIGTFRIEQPAFGLSISSTVTDASCPEKTDGAIDLDVKFGTPPYNFAWNSGENYEDLTDIATGSYIVTITDMNNCSTTDSIAVGTVQSTCLHVYNTITPNGDGKNDTWVIDGINFYPNCAVKVFNQWGNMVYSSTGYPENWDGTNNGHPLPAATYYYIIDLGNGEDPITGDLTIIRSTGNRMPIGPNHKKKKPDDKDNAENLINE